MIELRKGNTIDLHKEYPTLALGHCGLEWNINENGGPAFDLDFFMIGVNADGKATEDNLVFYGNKKSPTGAIYVMDDNLTGEDVSEGYDEEGFIKFADVPTDIHKVVCAVSIYEYQSRNQNFGQVDGAYCDVLNGETNEKLVHYDLSEDMSTGTGVIVGEFSRECNGWKFTAIGDQVSGGMVEILSKYGISASGGN